MKLFDNPENILVHPRISPAGNEIIIFILKCQDRECLFSFKYGISASIEDDGNGEGYFFQ